MYAVISNRNGTFHADAEGFTNLKQAIVVYHEICKNLWNAADVLTGSVIIANDGLFAVDGYREIITKDEQAG